MTTMFWILWFFIAFLVLLVAFTLRKENEEMPRRDILRAVESSGKMGVAERSFLWVFSWLDTRFRLQDYWNMSKGAYYNMHRQMPLTHAESTNSESSGTGTRSTVLAVSPSSRSSFSSSREPCWASTTFPVAKATRRRLMRACRTS